MPVTAKQSLRLVERVVSSLRGQILQGDFGEEGLLPSQAVIANQLGVSRSIVREGMHSWKVRGCCTRVRVGNIELPGEFGASDR